MLYIENKLRQVVPFSRARVEEVPKTKHQMQVAAAAFNRYGIYPGCYPGVPYTTFGGVPTSPQFAALSPYMTGSTIPCNPMQSCVGPASFIANSTPSCGRDSLDTPESHQ